MEYPVLDQMERFMADFDETAARMVARAGSLREMAFRASDDLGMVHVVVDHAGRIAGVDLDPRAVELTSDDLGWRINEAIRLAQQAAAEHTDQALATAFD
nr:YbaB/EbfC family nucleoid-associated protein [Micromonospora sp. DSM 115978]